MCMCVLSLEKQVFFAISVTLYFAIATNKDMQKIFSEIKCQIIKSPKNK